MRRFVLVITCCLPLGSGCLLLVDPPYLSDTTAPATGWVDLAVGYSRVCALDADGAMWCGSDVADLRVFDEGPFVSISEDGWGATCGVESGGVLRCDIGGSSPFELAGFYRAVSGSSNAGCGVEVFGDARCWPEATDLTGPFESVGAGDTFACGIREDTKSLQCWSIDNVIFDEALAPPAGSFSRVVTNDHVGCAITTVGSIKCWGYDFHDVLGGPPAGAYVDLSIRGNGCAVTTSGAIACWGDDAGDPNSHHLFPPAAVAFSRVSVGNDLSCGIATDTSLHCW